MSEVLTLPQVLTSSSIAELQKKLDETSRRGVDALRHAFPSSLVVDLVSRTATVFQAEPQLLQVSNSAIKMFIAKAI